jgi:threonine aldolase
VGDDVFGEDPTVRELEVETAALLGKEAALFTVSGTMANQLAIRSHTEPGDEILVEANAHLYYYEGGGPAALSGVMCRCLQGERGVFKGADVESALRPSDPHFPRTRWSASRTRTIAAAAKSGRWSVLKRLRVGAAAWTAIAPGRGAPLECGGGDGHRREGNGRRRSTR